MQLSALAPGKLNLCLAVGGPRDDGLHEVLTLIESVSLADELVLSTDHDAGPDEVVCPGIDGPNLVSRALGGLRAAGWVGPRVRIEIHKRVPVAAGMGGGSADAAAALRLANALHPVPDGVIGGLAAELGADVPSQLAPGASLGTGAGERLQPVMPLQPHTFVIVPPDRSLSTADVYAEADRLRIGRSLDELTALRDRLATSIERDGRPLEELIINDLEAAAISLCPSILATLEAVRDVEADHALVSGSGPTVFGLFWGEDSSKRAEAASKHLAAWFKGATSAVPVGADFGHPRVRAQSGVDR